MISSSLWGRVALPFVTIALLLCFLPSCLGHGWVSSPESRQGQCATGLVTGCGEIQYEPQSVQGLKGATTCNGDQSEWAILADDSQPWKVWPVGKGINKFTWTQTAIHVAADWEYWIGGTLVAQFLGTADTIHCVDLSAYSGYQKILAIWNIGDTPDAFYSCIDVNVGAGSVTTNCVGGGANVFTPPANMGCTSTTTSTSYTITSGDTFASIATSHHLTVAQILAVNPLLTATSYLEPGSTVIIPPTATAICTTSTGVAVTTTLTTTGSIGTPTTAGSTAVATTHTTTTTPTPSVPTTHTGSGTCTTTATSSYSVAQGDTLASIAAAKGITLAALVNANPSLIYVTQALKMPVGITVPCPSSTGSSSAVVAATGSHSTSTTGAPGAISITCPSCVVYGGGIRYTACVGATTSIAMSVTGSTPMTWALSPGPLSTNNFPGLTFSSTTGAITGSVNAATSNYFAITATNAYGTATQHLNIQVYAMGSSLCPQPASIEPELQSSPVEVDDAQTSAATHTTLPLSLWAVGVVAAWWHL